MTLLTYVTNNDSHEIVFGILAPLYGGSRFKLLITTESFSGFLTSSRKILEEHTFK